MTLTINIIIKAEIKRIFDKVIKSKIELKFYDTLILLFTDVFDFDL